MRISDWSSDVCSSDLFSWRTVVPEGVAGIQAGSVEGRNTAMALSIGIANGATNPAGTTLVAQARTTSQAQAALQTQAALQPGQTSPGAASANTFQIEGAEPTSLVGEPVKQAGEQQGAVKTPPSAFDNLRSAISPFEPVSSDIGSKDDTKARVQQTGRAPWRERE